MERERERNKDKVTAVDFLDSLSGFRKKENSTITATINLQWSKGIQNSFDKI